MAKRCGARTLPVVNVRDFGLIPSASRNAARSRIEPSALMGLALEIGLASFSLGIERVEGEIKVMVRQLAW